VTLQTDPADDYFYDHKMRQKRDDDDEKYQHKKKNKRRNFRLINTQRSLYFFPFSFLLIN
jgi:hypothetical protein